MISIFMIITALVPTALAKGSMECNVTGPTGDQKCFGALGEPLIFHLPTKESKLMLKKNGVYTILNTVNMIDSVILSEEYRQSAHYTNGTFKLDNARRNDSGDYQLQIFGSDGRLLHTNNIHLEIQAPVSKPAVSQMCLSPEQMNISCSSEGDEVEIILTLDGQNVMCHVHNNVSRDETVIQLTSCKGSISHLSLVTVAVIASVATLLLHLALFLGMKYLNKKTRLMTVNEDNAEDEIVYSDVRVMKHTRKIKPSSHQNAT